MTLPGSACTPRERSGKATSYTLRMMDVLTRRSAHHTNSGLGWDQFGLASVAKARGSGARRPELRGNGGCRHRTRPRLQPRRGEGQPEADPGQFLGELRSVEIQARQRGLSSSIATVIVFDSIETPGFGIYLTMLVQYCGRDKIDPCAKTILPKIDREIEKLRTSWPALWKKL